MKITLFIGSLIGGGAERVTCNLANFFVNRGYDVSILTMSETESYHLDTRVSTISLLKKSDKAGTIKSAYLRLVRLKEYMKKSDCDVYVVMLPITTILLLSLSRNTSAPVIASERSFPKRYPKWMQFLLRLTAKRASGWVFQTNEVYGWYKPNLGNSDSMIIPNAIELTAYDKDCPAQKPHSIVAAGRLAQVKRFDNLIRAFSSVIEEFPDSTLTIYGEGGERKNLETLVDKLSLKDKVFLPGFNQCVDEAIAGASIFVLSSDHEGMPNSLMEAMAMGVPCVATDVESGSTSFLIQNGVNGLLVHRNNVKELSDAMCSILRNPENAESLGNAAKSIRECLSPQKVYMQWQMYIDRIVGQRR